MKQNHVIYGLKEKASGEIFYVGRTNNLQRRMNEHFGSAIEGTHHNQDLGAHLRMHLKKNNVQVVVLKKFFGTAYDAEGVEIDVMKKLKAEGQPLLNQRYGRWKGNAVRRKEGEGEFFDRRDELKYHFTMVFLILLSYFFDGIKVFIPFDFKVDSKKR